MNLTQAILNELRCREAGMYVSIPALVEDYGTAVHATLVQMMWAGTVRLTRAADLSQWTREEQAMFLPADGGDFSGVCLS